MHCFLCCTKLKNADGWSGHGGGEAEGQWIWKDIAIEQEAKSNTERLRQQIDLMNMKTNMLDMNTNMLDKEP